MITGGCLCGAVRFEIDGKISPTWLCHCSKCRKVTGSAFHASAVCRKTRFRWLGGEDAISEYRDSPGYIVRFCRTCGSPVPSEVPDADSVFLHVGTLDGDPGTRLVHHIFVGSKAPWFEVTDEHPQYDEHKPSEG